ncbi:MAG: hypothetical protein HFJ28_06550 [Clostridia bacterium]|jgi:preprotein translocase subunit SecF|nr:hypothetical protein [Clostridia bacterium]
MKKEIIYGLAILLIIVGGIMIATLGLKADITYSKNVRIDVYLGKTFENEDMKQIANEVFGKDRILVQKIEQYGDMVSITITQKAAENVDEKVKELNEKINAKYELENKAEDIVIVNQPKIKLSSVLLPYIAPLIVSSIIVLVYVAIRFRKMGIFKILVNYIFCIVASEAVFLSILAIARIPINRAVMPIGLIIYIVTITIVTAVKENNYHNYQEDNK